MAWEMACHEVIISRGFAFQCSFQVLQLERLLLMCTIMTAARSCLDGIKLTCYLNRLLSTASLFSLCLDCIKMSMLSFCPVNDFSAVQRDVNDSSVRSVRYAV